MTERPDPDQLLAEVKSQEQAARRGRLRIYFGASAGVGKTWAMLAHARALRNEGRDVVIGIVETHGRKETESLTAGLETLPRAQIDYQGRAIPEFALDAALARHPALMLVDELAHTNAPGSRHLKRWQDIEELLAAGIDVFTTLNVQHLESLNDVVGGITGIEVRETVPDTFFDSADEVMIVDIPADDLIARLKAGKVYIPDEIERASRNFFRKGNLMALRELALRRTADRVDDQVLSYRREHIGTRIWQTQDALVVCVGPGAGGERQVRAAARLANGLDARWHAIYVETPTFQRLPEAQRSAVLRTLKLADDLGATTATIAAQDVTAAVIDYARRHNLARVVLGRDSPPGRFRWPWRTTIPARVARDAPDLDLVVIAGDDRAPPPPAREIEDRRGPIQWSSYAWTLATSAAVTLIATPLHGIFELANIVMLFLLATVFVAMRFGRGPATVAAIVNVLSFDFFFVPPRFSFAVSDVQYLFTFAVMLAVGLITGQLMASFRYQARIASYREDRASNLYAMARELSGALTIEQVAEIADRFVEVGFAARVAILLPDDNDRIAIAGGAGPRPGIDLAVGQWAYDHGEPAGLGTDTLSATPQLYMPLKAPMRTRGVVVVEPSSSRLLMIPEQRQLLETCAALIAIALERVHFVTVAQDTLVHMESERMRNSLLAALSHDVRTPLTALVGLADTLSIELAQAPPSQREKIEALREQAQRMAQLVANLLEMARLQAGGVQLSRDWQSLEEQVGASIRAAAQALGDHVVEVDLPPSLPLVHADAMLLERVFVNLLENAAKYAGPAAKIGITAHRDGREIVVEVWDTGPGIPPGKEVAIFEKFTRGDKESPVPGMGLGLAICRTIIEAHGGRIWAVNRSPSMGGGASFQFALPATDPPAPPPAEVEGAGDSV